MHPRLFLGACAAVLLAASPSFAQSKLLRFPDVHGDRVVFTYAGDLWTASVDGGTATRLTSHPGQELFAKFSPDGKWIAFTGQYDGDEQVYVMPSTGGVPKQLTFYPARGPLPPRWGYDNQVYDWTPDGQSILFRSLRDSWTLAQTKLFTVPVQGGLPKELPMPTAGAGEFSPDGSKLLYSPLFRDFRSWKRYQGGWAQDLFIFDLKTHSIEPIANSPRTERDPMWIGSKTYFASDRTGTLNLFEYDPASKKVRQLTNSTQWDVRWPSQGDKDRIVYEMDGELYILNVKSGDPKKIRIEVPTDGLASRPSHMNVGNQVAEFDLSPKGERALFIARGDIFTAPIEHGAARNLTHSSDAHDREATWSPDGKWIAYISDKSGEEEIYIIAQDGSGTPKQLTKNNSVRLYRPIWSPDSNKIAYVDKDGQLFMVTVSDGTVVRVAKEQRGMIADYVWSPDSRFLAFSQSNPNLQRSVHIWSSEDKSDHRVTPEFWDESNPAWDPEGNYLYFLGDREFAPIISQSEFNFATARMSSVFALTLKKDGKSPFPPRNDEVSVEADKKDAAKPADAAKADDAKKGDAAKSEAKKDGAKPVQIDFDGLEKRVTRFPMPASNYGNLSANTGHILVVRNSNPYYGRESEARPELLVYSIKDRKETKLADGPGVYALSQDGSKLLVREGPQFVLYGANPQGAAGKKTVSTAQLAVDRIPSQEWRQIFNEVWRRYRDYFYAKNMHGYDWLALKRQYEPLLEYVGHRSDLNYVISEMIAELNVGHAYIAGGDFEIPDRPKVALPGARFELDSASGRYKISEVFTGQNEETIYRSPLTEVGAEVKVGEYVLEVDGIDLAANENPYRLLVGKANQPVTLTVNSQPNLNGARKVTFQPIQSEEDLEYLKFVLGNRERVEKLSQGKVAYLHIPNMGAEGIREFIKWYYGQTRKEGVVIDVRSNGGGNVSRMLIERFRRQLLANTFSRTSEDVATYPDGLIYGHMVCLLNETSASDGDIFPAMFKQAKLGVTIGKRSWGGVVGITNHGNLMDGGQVNVPEFGFASPEGKWIVEGHGVDPDIVVENDPKSVIDGHDPQLERGVQEVLREMQEKPMHLPTRPADPIKTK